MIKLDIELERAKRKFIKDSRSIIDNYERKLHELEKQRDADLQIINRDYQNVVTKVSNTQRLLEIRKTDASERKALELETQKLLISQANINRELLNRKLEKERQERISKNGLHTFNDYRDIMK